MKFNFKIHKDLPFDDYISLYDLESGWFIAEIEQIEKTEECLFYWDRSNYNLIWLDSGNGILHSIPASLELSKKSRVKNYKRVESLTISVCI